MFHASPISRRAFLHNGLWLLAAPTILKAQSLKGKASLTGAAILGVKPTAGGGGGPSPFFVEQFEDATTGYDSSNTHGWIEDATPNPKYTTHILKGTQSYNSTADGTRSHCAITSSTELWIYYMVYYNTMTESAGWTAFTDASSQTYIEFNSGSGRMRVAQGSSFSPAISTGISAATVYHIKHHWKNDGTASMEWSADSSGHANFLGSGNNFQSVSGGNGNTAITTIYIGLGHASDIVIDNFKLFSSDPGADPSAL